MDDAKSSGDETENVVADAKSDFMIDSRNSLMLKNIVKWMSNNNSEEEPKNKRKILI